MQGLKWAAHEMHFRGDVGQGSENWCLCARNIHMCWVPPVTSWVPPVTSWSPSSSVTTMEIGGECARGQKLKQLRKRGFKPDLSFLYSCSSFLPLPLPSFLPLSFLFPSTYSPSTTPPLLLSSGSYSPGYMNSLNSQCWSWCLDLPVSAFLVLGL